MTDAQRDYWTECIEIAFDENGITATPAQIEATAGDVEGCHDNYGLAFYTPSHDPREDEIERLRKELQAERNKVICTECNGRGRIITQGPHHSSNSECWECRGDGRL